MSAPYEVLVGPLAVYVAPVGTAFPDTNAAPGGSWFLLGTNGAKNYDEKGVTVSHNQTFGSFTPAAGTAKRKVWRQAEQLMIGFELVDLTVEQYAKNLNNAVVTTASGPPATKSFPLQQGITVATFALLARGISPIADTLPAQYQVPMVYQAEQPKPGYNKQNAASLTCSYEALDEPTLAFGSYVAQTA